MTFPETITIRFNPPSLFSHEHARTFYLLWRCTHIVGQGFDEVARDVGSHIAATKIETGFDLAECMAKVDGHNRHQFNQLGDRATWPEWGDAALPYFTGQKSIGCRVEIPSRIAATKPPSGDL